jgi:hypothetical protein
MSLKTRILMAAATVLTATALVAAGAGPAAAGTAQPAAAQIDGWQRVVTQPFTSPAGDLCPFALHSEPLVDLVYVRTTATFPDGSPQRQQYAGPLIVRLSSATGASIVRNLSGAAIVTYAADGSYDFRIIGPAAVGFRAYRGDNLPTGFYVLSGIHVVHFAADGIRTLTVDRGTEENVCATLA